jgi:hypothetical protein
MDLITSGAGSTFVTLSAVNSLVVAPTPAFTPPAGPCLRLTPAPRPFHGSRRAWTLMAGNNAGTGVAGMDVAVTDLDRTDVYTQGIAKHDFSTRSGPICSPPV